MYLQGDSWVLETLVNGSLFFTETLGRRIQNHVLVCSSKAAKYHQSLTTITVFCVDTAWPKKLSSFDELKQKIETIVLQPNFIRLTSDTKEAPANIIQDFLFFHNKPQIHQKDKRKYLKFSAVKMHFFCFGFFFCDMNISNHDTNFYVRQWSPEWTKEQLSNDYLIS